jgi:hypothetical protein
MEPHINNLEFHALLCHNNNVSNKKGTKQMSKVLLRASNLVYSLRHEKTDDLELIDTYEILKSCIELVEEQAKEQNILYILEK